MQFRPTNYSNDNLAVLVAGFNKEIEKSTAILLKQEKEAEAYQAIKNLLDKEANNDLHHEAEATNPAFKLFLKFRQENGANAYKKCNEKIKHLDDKLSSLRSKILTATNQVAQLSKNATKKSKVSFDLQCSSEKNYREFREQFIFVITNITRDGLRYQRRSLRNIKPTRIVHCKFIVNFETS